MSRKKYLISLFILLIVVTPVLADLYSELSFNDCSITCNTVIGAPEGITRSISLKAGGYLAVEDENDVCNSPSEDDLLVNDNGEDPVAATDTEHGVLFDKRHDTSFRYVGQSFLTCNYLPTEGYLDCGDGKFTFYYYDNIPFPNSNWPGRDSYDDRRAQGWLSFVDLRQLDVGATIEVKQNELIVTANNVIVPACRDHFLYWHAYCASGPDWYNTYCIKKEGDTITAKGIFEDGTKVKEADAKKLLEDKSLPANVESSFTPE